MCLRQPNPPYNLNTAINIQCQLEYRGKFAPRFRFYNSYNSRIRSVTSNQNFVLVERLSFSASKYDQAQRYRWELDWPDDLIPTPADDEAINAPAAPVGANISQLAITGMGCLRKLNV